MLLTYKIKHHTDLTLQLRAGFEVAKFGLLNKQATSKDVKHFGLPSNVSCNTMRKYKKSKTIKEVRNVKLCVSNQGLKQIEDILVITPLKITIDISHIPPFEKVNYVELGKDFAYVTVTTAEKKVFAPKLSLGVDRNSTKHIVVAGLSDGSVIRKMGSKAPHIHKKYKNIRTRLQRLGLYKVVKKIKQRESNIVRDLNHKISKELVAIAVKNQADIKLEDLEGIKKVRIKKRQKYTLNSWSFHQLQLFVEYKAKKSGVTVSYVAPQYTSKSCSKCGYIGIATNTKFVCQCGYVTHRDVNACLNISHLNVGDCIEKKIYTKGALIPLNRQLNKA